MSSSSTFTPTSLSASDTAPTASSTDQSSGDGFSSRGAANYFFGFLFLFTVILLILVGCGIGTRRRLFSTRPIISQPRLGPWTPGAGGEITPPKIHETESVVTRAAGWKDIMVNFCALILFFTFLACAYASPAFICSVSHQRVRFERKARDGRCRIWTHVRPTCRIAFFYLSTHSFANATQNPFEFKIARVAAEPDPSALPDSHAVSSRRPP